MSTLPAAGVGPSVEILKRQYRNTKAELQLHVSELLQHHKINSGRLRAGNMANKIRLLGELPRIIQLAEARAVSLNQSLNHQRLFANKLLDEIQTGSEYKKAHNELQTLVKQVAQLQSKLDKSNTHLANLRQSQRIWHKKIDPSRG